MAYYEIILRSPNGIMESKGVYETEEAIAKSNEIRRGLIKKYGSAVAYKYSIHICTVEMGEM